MAAFKFEDMGYATIEIGPHKAEFDLFEIADELYTIDRRHQRDAGGMWADGMKAEVKAVIRRLLPGLQNPSLAVATMFFRSVSDATDELQKKTLDTTTACSSGSTAATAGNSGSSAAGS